MKIKKFVALLLVLLLCIGIFPVSAFADDSEGNVVAVEETTEQIIEEVESDPIEEDLIPEEQASANEEAEDAEIVEEGIDAEEEIPEDASAEEALAEDISEEEIVEEEPEEANDSEMSDSAITEDDDVVEVAEVVDEAIDETKEIVEEVVTNDVVTEDSADDSWKEAGLFVISNGVLVPYNPINEGTVANRGIPSGIHYRDLYGAHGSDLNGYYIKAGGYFDSWIPTIGNNVWWPSSGVYSPNLGKNVYAGAMFCNEGPNHYKTQSGVLAIPIRPSQESGWSMDVDGYGNYTMTGSGVPGYKKEGLYSGYIPGYSNSTWTQISLVYGVARGMGGMVKSGNTNITAAASTLINNIVFGYISLGSDKVFHGKPLMTTSTAVNQQMAQILVRCEVYSKEKGLTGSKSGDNTLNLLRGSGFSTTDVTGWYVKSGTASFSNTGYFRIYKSQSSGNQVYVYATNAITFDSGVPVSLVKTSADTDESVLECIRNNPLYTLKGAVYEIHEGSEDGPVVATLTTDENGKASSGDKRFAVNTVLYAKEIKAPSGYELNERVYSITVSADSSQNVFRVSDKPSFDPSAITIRKTGTSNEWIGGTVFKAEFFAANWENPERLLRTWYFESDADGYIEFNEAHFADDTVYHSDPMFKPYGSNQFPLGCVKVQEVKTANGYVLPEGTDGIIYLFIRQGGAAQLSGKKAQAYWGKASGGELTGDEVYGIYELTNDDDGTGLIAVNEEALTATMVKTSSDNNVEGFKFKLYQNETHTSWYGVSDDKGNIYVTDELYQVIEPKTNVFENLTNGKYLLAEVDPGLYAPSEIVVSAVKTNESGETSEEVVAKFVSGSEEYPIKFSKTNEGAVAYKTGFFQIDGLNGGDSIKFAIKNVKPEIKTFATNENGEKSISAYSTAAVVMDKVSCENLVPGHKYVAMGELFDAATGESLGVKNQSAEVEATSSKMDINVKLVVDATKYKGKTLVVYEELKDVTIDMVVAEHKDKNDKDQQVDVLSMHTTASGIVGKVALPLHDAEIKDVVHMDNLIIGKQYTVSGKLVDKDTEEVIATAQETFEAKKTSMDVTVIFKVDLREYAGKSVVVFEYLYDKVEITDDDQPIADHAELNDEDQTVEVVEPKIRTYAADPDGNKLLSVRKDVDLVDTIYYENLIPGLTYELSGILMNVATGEPLMVNGKEVVVTETFVPEEANGTHEMHFKFDATDLGDFTVVVFEELKYKDEVLCEHKVLEDLDQTVYFPELHTTATDGNGSKTFPTTGTIKIVDTVNYKNLIVGKEYKLIGTLHDKATGEALKDANGNVITAETTFVAETEEGVIDVIFEVDASVLAPYTVVVFEDLYEGEREICVHADVNDEAQTVYFPEIGTTLTDDAGRKNLDPKKDLTLVDKISYKNLEPDVKYIMVGKIMDAETGKVLVIDGKEVVAEKEFIPKTADGEINMSFSFNGSDLYGKTVVAFEYLYRVDTAKDEEGNETTRRTFMVSHEDIKDKNQTVTFEVRTGDENDLTIYWIILGASLVVIAGLVIVLIKVRKNKKK